MIKRIPCRVIKSIPLGVSNSHSGRFFRPRTPDSAQARINNIAQASSAEGDTWQSTADVQTRHPGRSAIYTHRSGIIMETPDSDFRGQILDCYA